MNVLMLISIVMLIETEANVYSESQTSPQARHISPEIPVQSQPVGIAVNSNTSKIYVSNSLSNTVSVIDGLTNRVINYIDVGSFLTSLAVDSRLNRIYVVNGVSHSISVIDGFTDKIKGEIKIDSSPQAVYVDRPYYYVITNNSLLSFMDPNVNPLNVFTHVASDFHYGLTTDPTMGRVYITKPAN